MPVRTDDAEEPSEPRPGHGEDSGTPPSDIVTVQPASGGISSSAITVTSFGADPDNPDILPLAGEVRGRSTLAANASLTAEGTLAQPVATWETAARGEVQAKLEEVVGLLDRSDLLTLLGGDDRLIAEGIKALLIELSHVADTPDKEVAIGPLKWLGRKVDLFLDEAVKTAGKAAGVAVVGAAAIYIPQLHHVLSDLNALAGKTGA